MKNSLNMERYDRKDAPYLHVETSPISKGNSFKNLSVDLQEHMIARETLLSKLRYYLYY